ncbi:hypothetical protein DFH09DRAFT_1315929 [Mycena vulgaris]|nr:hypothetical protein DFH09DRAFT_1315929 [Mycena vulgaris]
MSVTSVTAAASDESFHNACASSSIDVSGPVGRSPAFVLYALVGGGCFVQGARGPVLGTELLSRVIIVGFGIDKLVFYATIRLQSTKVAGLQTFVVPASASAAQLSTTFAPFSADILAPMAMPWSIQYTPAPRAARYCTVYLTHRGTYRVVRIWSLTSPTLGPGISFFAPAAWPEEAFVVRTQGRQYDGHVVVRCRLSTKQEIVVEVPSHLFRPHVSNILSRRRWFGDSSEGFPGFTTLRQSVTLD